MSLKIELRKLEKERAGAQAELARPRPDLVDAFGFHLPKRIPKDANIILVNQIVTGYLQSLKSTVAAVLKGTNQLTILLGKHEFTHAVMEWMEENQAEVDGCQESIKALEKLNAKHQIDKVIEKGQKTIKDSAMKIVGLKVLHNVIAFFPTDVIRITVDYLY